MLKKIDLNFISFVFFIAILPLDLSFLSRTSYVRSATIVDEEVILSNLFEIIVWGLLYIFLFYRFIKNLIKIQYFYSQNLVLLFILFLFLISISVSLSLDIYLLRGVDFYLWCIFIIMFTSISCLANSEDWKAILSLIFKVLLTVLILNFLFTLLFPENGFSAENRLRGFFGNANALARLSSILFILSISNYKFRIIKISKSLNLITTLISLTTVFLTGSATSIVGIIFLSIIIGLQYIKVYTATAIISFLFLAILLIYSFILLTSAEIFFSFFGRDTSLSGRDIAWAYALEYIGTINFFGYGLSDTRHIFEDAYISSTNMHNNFLEFYFRTGAFGLIIHIAILVMTTINFFSPKKEIVLSYFFLFLFICGFLNSIAFSIRSFEGLLYWTSLIYIASNTLTIRSQIK